MSGQHEYTAFGGGEYRTPEEGDVPWIPVGANEAVELLRAYRHARTCVDELRDALRRVGFDAKEIPDLCATVDAAGQPVILLGRVRASTVLRLARLLRGLPAPPAADRMDASEGEAQSRAG